MAKQSMDPLQARRVAIVTAALPHMAFDGWRKSGLRAGAVDAGFEAEAADLAFPEGPIQAFATWSAMVDQALEARLEALGLPAMKIRERVTTGVRERILLLAPHREAVRSALRMVAVPMNGRQGLKALYGAVDTIWRAAGDTATDYNFYTKRMLLAGVWQSTLLYWLTDGSDNYAETWAFLDRRIADVMRIPQATGKVKGWFANLPGLAGKVFSPGG